MRRACRALVAAAAATLVAAAPAEAHGLAGRSDLPIPEWLFAYAAAAVLIASFGALAVLWRTPRLEGSRPRRLVRLPRWLDVACGTVGVLAFAALVYAGLAGSQNPRSNAVPTTVFVLFWVGVPIVSALVGDVFRPFNPWRTIGRASGWAVQRLLDEPPPPLRYPERLGRWPAVIGLLAFGWLELIAANRDSPTLLATLAMIYLAVQLVGMSIYGVGTWSERGDAFGLYFAMFARMGPLTAEDGFLAVRRPLSGLTTVEWLPGTLAMMWAAIGITAFDGASQGHTWTRVSDPIQRALADLGASLGTALQLAFTLGLLLAIAVIAGFYRLGISGVHREAPDRPVGQIARRFGHSLMPIAFAYILAHYFSLFVYQGQAVVYLVSDPLGDGSDLFGTATVGIDYGLVSATAIWYVQVASLVAGHVAALLVAHDRALVDFGPTRTAVRSQYWMLAVMVSFTTLGLWLLSEANG